MYGKPLSMQHKKKISQSNMGKITHNKGKKGYTNKPDARNHGESPHPETMSYKEMAEDVVCFLDNNGLERIMLLGHSMGGNTAM